MRVSHFLSSFFSAIYTLVVIPHSAVRFKYQQQQQQLLLVVRLSHNPRNMPLFLFSITLVACLCNPATLTLACCLWRIFPLQFNRLTAAIMLVLLLTYMRLGFLCLVVFILSVFFLLFFFLVFFFGVFCFISLFILLSSACVAWRKACDRRTVALNYCDVFVQRDYISAWWQLRYRLSSKLPTSLIAKEREGGRESATLCQALAWQRSKQRQRQLLQLFAIICVRLLSVT